MTRIGSRGSRVNQKLEELLPAGQIERQAAELDHQWRERKLGPAMTVYLWIMQVLQRNLSGAGSRHLHAGPLSASAVCQAKRRLPLRLLRQLCAYLVSRIGHCDTALWHGHRVFAGDAVSYYTPDTPQLRKAFGSKKRFGFPLLKSLALVSLCNGVMTHQIPLPHDRQETPLLTRLLRHLRGGDLLVLDRAFASFWNLLQARQTGVHLLVRLKQCFWAEAGTRRTVIKKLGKRDLLVCWTRPKERSRISLWRWVRMPRELTLRQVSLGVRRRGYRTRQITLITTLIDPIRYPAGDMAALYHRRWEIETCFRHLKQTLNLEHLRCKTLPGVRKELMVRTMAYNLVRATMRGIAELLDVRATRVSFADTLQWLTLSCGDDDTENIVIINPLRPDRFEPRKLKRQNKNFLAFHCTRAEARKKVA